MFCERKLPSQQFSNVLFLTENTDEQNTQKPTETLSQPITQNLTATEASPPAPLRMERGVITEIPLYVIHAFSVSSPFLSRPIGVTSHTTPLSNRRGVGGEAAVISIREGTVLLFYHVTFLSPNNALHDTKKVTNLSHHRLFTCLITRYKDK